MKKLRTLTAILAVFLLFLVPATAVQAENTHSIDLEASNSEYLSIADSEQTGLDVTGDITIEADIKLESAPSGQDYSIVSKYEWENSDDRSYWFFYRNLDGTNTLKFASTADGTGDTQVSVGVNYDLNINTWYHIAVTYDVSTQEIKFYDVDGNQIGSTQTASESNIHDSTAPFVIGGTNGGRERYFDGEIDNIRIWNDIRTPTEIANNSNTELTGGEANLVAYWKFNDSLLDTSGYNNTLTNHSASFSTDVPFIGSTETASCSCTGDNIDFEVATDLLGTGSQNMVLGTDSGGVPTVCVNQVGGSFLDEFTFFNNTWTPVSVTQIPGTDQISVIAYDAQGSYSEQIVDTSSEETVTTNDL